MRFDQPLFLFGFLPALLAAYYAVFGLKRLSVRVAGVWERLAAAVVIGGSAWLIVRSPVGPLLLGSAFLTILLGAVAEQVRAIRPAAAQLALTASMTATVAMFALARWLVPGRVFELAGAAVLACQELAFVLDLHAGRATTANPATAWLYLVQFPVLPAGPVTRFHEVERRWRHLGDALTLGSFTYGTRRLITGLVKVMALANTLAVPVDAIYRLPPSRLGTDAAWLAAVCYPLQLYFLLSGYADIAIGLGRMVGLRYPENFHRPYLADSVREFWSRWHVTSITWLRDYFAFPIAGRDAPTFRRLPAIVGGFALLGFWYGGGWTVAAWAVYSSALLAVETLGFGVRLSSWPKAARHAYVLVVVTAGWVLLRSDSIPAAWNMLATLAGLRGVRALTIGPYLTLQVWMALLVAIVGAGPLIPWLSRWRVSVDAVTASIVMMMTSLSIFVWRASRLLIRTVLLSRGNSPKKT